MVKLVDTIKERLKVAVRCSFNSKPLTRKGYKRFLLIIFFSLSILFSVFYFGLSVYSLFPQFCNSEFVPFILLLSPPIILTLIRFSAPLNPGKYVAKIRKRFGFSLWFVFGTTHLVSIFIFRDRKVENFFLSSAFSAIFIFVVSTVRVIANFERDSVPISRSIILQSVLATALSCCTGNYAQSFPYFLPVLTGIIAQTGCPGSLDYVYCDSADRLPAIFLEFRPFNF